MRLLLSYFFKKNLKRGKISLLTKAGKIIPKKKLTTGSVRHL